MKSTSLDKQWAIGHQTETLLGYKRILKKSIYLKLVERVTKDNEIVETGEEICRGESIHHLVKLLALNQL